MHDYLTTPLTKRRAFHKANPNARAYPAAYGYIDTREGQGMRRDSDGTTPSYSADLRFAGISDEILKLRHEGWYVDRYRHEVTRGVIYRLPSGRGFLAGWTDPWNADKDGRGPCNLELRSHPDEREAARAAERLAELAAERMVEDSLEQEAQYRLEQALEDATRVRNDIRDIIGDMRDQSIHGVAYATLCRKIRDLRRDYLSKIEQARDFVECPSRILG